MEVTYRVGDFKRLISESSNEFKAVIGAGVESKDKETNGKAYKDAKQRAKDYDGGLSDKEDKTDYKKEDYNRTLLDYNVDNISKDQKDRIHALADGYSSVAEKNNGIEKSGDYSKNEKIYQAIKKSGKEIHDNEKAIKKSGLQANKMPDDFFQKDELYESKDGIDMRKMIDNISKFSAKSKVNENIKTVWFKKTSFLNEEHMFSKIPDEFKSENSQFRMRDKNGNEYIVEWKNNKGVVLEHSNKNGGLDSISRMKSLYEYSRSDSKTSSSSRLIENEDKFEETLNKMRRIIK